VTNNTRETWLLTGAQFLCFGVALLNYAIEYITGFIIVEASYVHLIVIAGVIFHVISFEKQMEG
jgi:diacylglycerol kinase